MSTSEPVGFGHPPRSTRFKPGKSGNPGGRPRNRKRQHPHEALLGQMVTIREDGRDRRVTAAEAFLLQLTQKGLAGDSAAARASLDAIEAARAKRRVHQGPLRIIWTSIGDGTETVLQPLAIATKKYPTDERRVRWELHPWIVEVALDRLGASRLTVEEQHEVWRNTLEPAAVNWPDWWTVRG
jgi:hypothetical protein